PCLRASLSPPCLRSLIPRPRRSTLFPYTTLFRSLVIYQREEINTFIVSKVMQCPGDISFPFKEPEVVLIFRQIVFILLHILTLIDRKSTRLNSSHVKISYAVFCLKKKKRIVIWQT